MILSGASIAQAVKNGDFTIEPFDSAKLKGASYTFTLAPKLLILKKGDVLTPDSTPQYQEIVMGNDGYVLEPGAFAVGFTMEKLSLNGKYVCFLSNRASCAKLGLNVLLGSDFAEPDTDNPQTLEMHNAGTNPIKLEAGMKIAKGVFSPLA